MEITLEEVKEKFIDIINNKITLEEANDWAFSLVQQSELENLIYIPRKDEEKIWKGIMYLYGIDLQVEPGEYLHCKEDIKDKFKNLFEK